MITENDKNTSGGDLYRVVDDAENRNAESGVLSKGRVPLKERMTSRVQTLTEKLNLDNVEVVEDGSSLDGRRKRAKGFYNNKTGKITIVIGNHGSVADAERTLMHEAVAHYGLRRLLGKGFDRFLDYVFLNAKGRVKERIGRMMTKEGLDRRTATEEYLASMAEEADFRRPWAMSWTHKIKDAFVRVLDKAGFSLGPVTMSDNDMKYWLWQSYRNMKKPFGKRGIVDLADEISMKSRLGVP